MNNIDVINSIISKKLQLKENIVKSVNQYFWKEVKRKMTHLEDTTLFIKGLCSFTVSRYLLNNQILDLIQVIRNTRKSRKFTETRKQLILDKHYSYLRKLLKQRNELAIRYYELNNRVDKVDTESIEQFGEDSGGDMDRYEVEMGSIT